MSGLAAQLRLLLPPESYDGAAPTLSALLGAEANALDIAQISSDRLGDKIWPDTGAALDEYERVLGLPDPCLTGESLAVRQRIAAVMAKLNGLGGQSRAFFIQLAASLGYAISITEFKPARAGLAVAGDAVNGAAWTSAWMINAEPVTVFVAKAGSAAAGESLAVWGNKLLECRMRLMQPAHTTLIFSYGVK